MAMEAESDNICQTDPVQVADCGLVSIIMPSYNTGAYIASSIESVLRQTYQNWELIIVDDCSTDDTDAVVSSKADSRIRYIKNTDNQGAALSRNRALREAKGRWIAFLDSDDLWLPDKLERQLSFMIQENCQFSFSDYCTVDSNGVVSKDIITAPDRIDQRTMSRYCYPGALTVMYDACRIGLVQIPDLKKNNDYALWLNVVKKSDAIRLPACLAIYRRRDNSISSGRKTRLIKHHYIMFRDGMGYGRTKSLVGTLRNVAYGVNKKVKYRKAFSASLRNQIQGFYNDCSFEESQ